MKSTIKFFRLFIIVIVIGLLQVNCANKQRAPNIEMVLINGGTFIMGSPETDLNRMEDEKQRTNPAVTLTSFYMGKYQVTQVQYKAVMNSANPSYFKGDNLPVEQISWFDAIVFCNKLSIMEGLKPAYSISGSADPDTRGEINSAWEAAIIDLDSNGYRLPTEAQWEYACRAGTESERHFIETEIDDYAWHNKNSNGITHNVGLKQPNAWGLYDMHGNVNEWCWDKYSTLYDNAGGNNNPMGAVYGLNRVLRGGSYFTDERNLRSARRRYSIPHKGPMHDVTGFRLVRPIN